MGKPRPILDTTANVSGYRDLAKEALENVAIYKARAQWFASSGNQTLVTEYTRLAQEALSRAQRYKDLADLAEKHSQPSSETSKKTASGQ